MPFYIKSGKLPNKRHIQFRDADKNLYWEELISRHGFSHIYSNAYHLSPPTAIRKIGDISNINSPQLGGPQSLLSLAAVS